MEALNKTAASMAAFGRMARRVLGPAPVALSTELFPVGQSGAWGELMSDMGIKAISFELKRWKEETMSGYSYALGEVRGVFELDNGQRCDFSAAGDFARLGLWAIRTGLRLEASEGGPRWVAPSKRAAEKTRWAKVLEEESLNDAAQEARHECGLTRGLIGRWATLKHERFRRDNPEFAEWEAAERKAKAARF